VSRIAETFRRLRENRRTALVPYLAAGYPSPSATVAMMHAAVAAGADILELGVPFSDPAADGPVIQKACEEALAQGVTLADVLGMVARFREQDSRTPVVLMGYLNPVETRGEEQFADGAARAGVDGVLLVDMPPEESGSLAPLLRRQNLDLIRLLSPTTSAERRRRICDSASGFVYYVSIKGVTGAGGLDLEDVRRRVGEIGAVTELPVGVGFGIRTPQTAAAVAGFADAVIVGSALIQAIQAADHPADDASAVVGRLVGEFRTALDVHPANASTMA
jgi:tryptophan synthase alpha chain